MRVKLSKRKLNQIRRARTPFRWFSIVMQRNICKALHIPSQRYHLKTERDAIARWRRYQEWNRQMVQMMRFNFRELAEKIERQNQA